MLHRFLHHKIHQVQIAFWLLVALLLVSCAPPAPPRVSPQTTAADPAALIFVADPQASSADRDAALSQFGNPPLAAYANLDGVMLKYPLGRPINESDGGILLTSQENVPEDLLAQLLYAMAVTDSSYACVQRGDQAFGAISLLAWQELATGQSTSGSGPNQCGSIAGGLAVEGECEKCGCIPPMGGNPPVCHFPGMMSWRMDPVIATPTPTP